MHTVAVVHADHNVPDRSRSNVSPDVGTHDTGSEPASNQLAGKQSAYRCANGNAVNNKAHGSGRTLFAYFDASDIKTH